MNLAQAWLRDLIAVGYDFPELRAGKIMWHGLKDHWRSVLVLVLVLVFDQFEVLLKYLT